MLHERIVQLLDAPQRIREPRHHRGSRRQLPTVAQTTVARTTQPPAEIVVVSSFEIFSNGATLAPVSDDNPDQSGEQNRTQSD
jgi:hypothetical protein